MRKAMVSLTLFGLTALASSGDAHAQGLGYGYGARGYSPYYGGGYGYGYGGYGNVPYYQSYGYGTVPGGYYSGEQPMRQAFYYGAETAPPYATVTIVVPTADAQLWFGETAMAQQGMVRVFRSPALEPGKNFSYTLRARWLEQGQAVERNRQVYVQAGQRVNVDFRDPSENAPAPDALRPTNGAPAR